MKWGVRKDNPQKVSKRTKSTDFSKMSDNELRERINRLNMERQYSQMTQTRTSKGRGIVTKIIGDVGKELAKEIIKNSVKKVIKSTTSR